MDKRCKIRTSQVQAGLAGCCHHLLRSEVTNMKLSRSGRNDLHLFNTNYFTWTGSSSNKFLSLQVNCIQYSVLNQIPLMILSWFILTLISISRVYFSILHWMLQSVSSQSWLKSQQMWSFLWIYQMINWFKWLFKTQN